MTAADAFSTALQNLASAFEDGDEGRMRPALAHLLSLPWSAPEQRAMVLAIHDEIKKSNAPLLPMLTPAWDRLDPSVRKDLKPLARQAVLAGDAPAVSSLLPYVRRYQARAEWLNLAMSRDHFAVMAALVPGTGDLTCAEVLMDAVKTSRPEAVRLLLTRTYTDAHLQDIMVQAIREAYENSANGRHADEEERQVLQMLAPRVDLKAVGAQVLAKQRGRELGMLVGLVEPRQMADWLGQLQADRGRLHPDLAEAVAWVQSQERYETLAQRPATAAPARRRHRA